MTWRPKRQSEVTAAEAAHAKTLLALAVWKLGVIEEAGSVQYRGAMHPDADGVGTHRGVEVWTNAPAPPSPAPKASTPASSSSSPRRGDGAGLLALVILFGLLALEG